MLFLYSHRRYFIMKLSVQDKAPMTVFRFREIDTYVTCSVFTNDPDSEFVSNQFAFKWQERFARVT